MAIVPLQASLGAARLFPQPSDSNTPSGPKLTAEQQDSLLQGLARQSGQFLETLGLLLDTPGAIARGVLAGDPSSGFNWDTEKRTSGAELLESLGVKPENPYVRAIASLGTEIVTDPLFWFSGGLGAVSQAGDAARAAGIIKNAPLAYMQKFGTPAAEATQRGKYISGLFDSAMVPKSAGNYQAVSPVGQRLAQSKVTLEDVVRASSNQDEALRGVVDRLGSMDEYERVKGDTLGGLFGINVGGINKAFNVPGGDRVLDAMDALGARARFSYPGRLATGLFSKKVEGAVDVGEQIDALRANTLEDMYRVRGQTEATRHGMLLTKVPLSENAKQLLGADTLFSPQGNDFLVRLAEGHPTATDQQILAMTPELNDWLGSWRQISNRQFSEREAFGLGGGKFSDPYGTEYLPRYGDEFDFEDMAKGTGRTLYSASEVEAYGRKPYLMTPGGTDDLRKISLLPEIIEYSNPASTIPDEQAGRVIQDWFAANHPAEPIGEAQALKIATVMKRRAQDLPPGTPVFAAHPANTQARRIINHEVAKSRAAFLLEAVSEAAVEGARSQQLGRYRNLAESWDEIASKSGFQTMENGTSAGKDAVNALRASISQATGTPVEQVDLAQYAIPERVVRRLQRIADFYSAPEAQKEVAGFLDGWTKLFKGFVLATPRRFVRDAYSNAISGWLETGSAPRQLAGMYAASKIVNGDYAGSMDALRSIPRYAGLGSDEAIKDAFIMDVGGNGVLSGLQSSELLSSAREGRMGQLIPGSTPISITKGLAELIPDGSTSFAQKVRNFGSIYGVTDMYDTQNPILRASAKVGDTVDSIGRLGTFIALMQQGVSPVEAAARVKKALVDYQSLTLTERKWMRTIFPWWAYNSRIGKYVADSLISRPGGPYGQMIRSLNTLQQQDDSTYIPENLRQKFAVRVPDEWLQAAGMHQPGLTTYAVDFDAPGADVANIIDPRSPVQGTLKNLAQQSAPPIQALMSLVTGRDLFYDRPLDETVTPADRIYKAITGSPEGLSGAAKVGINLIPGLQVPLSIGGTLTDQRIESIPRRAMKAGINFASGIKEATVDDLALIHEQQEKIGGNLAGKTRTMSRQYIPDELVPTLTPQQQQLWALSKILEKQSRQIMKQREQAKQQPAQTYIPLP